MPRSKGVKTPKKIRRINHLRLFVIVAAVLVIAGVLSGVGLMVHASQGLPEVIDLKERLSSTSFIYNADGTEQIAALHDVENRIIIGIDKMPIHLQEAFIAIEDERFYSHFGVDVRAFMRAIVANVTDRSMSQGGSTITQQLARNTYLTRQKIIVRKVQEWILAIQMERMYTKADILEMYLNQVFLGYNAYGVEAASNHYFGKDASEITLAESALLAGITQAPNPLSPHNNFDGAKERQEVVLNLMVRNGFVTEDEAVAAKEEEINIVPIRTSKYNYPYFVDYVLSQLLETYGPETVYRGGLKVYTTIDSEMQSEAEEAFADILDDAFPPKDGEYAPQGALISIDPNNGYIKAIVGGRNHQEQMGLNRVFSSRQPGSAFKPVVVFAPAIAQGVSPATIIEDARITLKAGSSSWSPRNYNDRYLGPVPLREASARSINTVAVRLIDMIGVNTAINSIKNLGITTLELDNPQVNDTGPAIALGGLTRGTMPMELNSAYGVFATGGKLAEPISILKVVDRNGIVLEENSPRITQVLDPGVAFLVTNMLKDTIGEPYGTGYRNANIGRPAAGKTGTTNDDRDAWFVGYTPDLVTTVWLGHDRDKTMTNVYGGQYPARIWARVMRVGHRNLKSKDWKAPRDVVSVRICTVSGLPAGEFCPTSAIGSDYFLASHVPTETCDVHFALNVCAESGLLPGEYCTDIVQKIFTAWPESRNFTKPYGSDDIPTTTCTTCQPPPPPPSPPSPPPPPPSPPPPPEDDDENGDTESGETEPGNGNGGSGEEKD